MEKKYKNATYTSLEINDEERRAIQEYIGVQYQLFNNILESGVGNERHFYDQDMLIQFGSTDIKRVIDNIAAIYSAMYKNRINNGRIHTVYRGTSLEDISRLEDNGEINKFTSTTLDSNMARGFFSLNWKRPAYVDINVGEDVPWIDIQDVLGEEYNEKWEKEVLLSPFLMIDKMAHFQSRIVDTVSGKGKQHNFEMSLKKKNLEMISEEEAQILENYLVNSAGQQSANIVEVFEIMKQIDELNQQLTQNTNALREYRIDINRCRDSKEKRLLMEDYQEIENIINSIQGEINEKISRKSDLLADINNWKNSLRILCMSRCREKEIEVERNVAIEEQQFFEMDESKRLQEQRAVIDKNKSDMQNSIRSIAENVDVNSDRISEIITNQNRLRAIADEMGVRCFEYIENPREIIEAQNELINAIRMMKEKTDRDFGDDSLNTDVSRQLLQKMHSTAGFCDKVSGDLSALREDFFSGIEDKQFNALKKGIYDKFFIIKAYADSEKLSKEIEQINNRGRFRKVFDKITGKEKINNARLNSLKLAIERIEKKREYIECNVEPKENERYSVHDMLADMQIFIQENGNNPELSSYIEEIKKLQNGVTGVFKVDQAKVSEIVDKKKTQRFPIEVSAFGKVGKKGRMAEDIARETEEFLISSGYTDDRSSKMDGHKVSNQMKKMQQISYHIQNATMRIRNYIGDGQEMAREQSFEYIK